MPDAVVEALDQLLHSKVLIKTPPKEIAKVKPGISKVLPRLTEKDLRAISSDRNVPEVLRITARQKIVLHKK